MKSTSRHFRPLALAAVVAATAATSGCHWFSKDHHWFGHDKSAKYLQSQENRPLEVPPDMSQPDTSNAVAMPAASAVGTSVAAPISGMLLSVNAATAFPRIAAVLQATEGVTINSQSEALGTFDVSYQGETFLVRVQDSQGGSRLLALSPDGQVLGTGAAAALMEVIKTKL